MPDASFLEVTVLYHRKNGKIRAKTSEGQMSKTRSAADWLSDFGDVT